MGEVRAGHSGRDVRIGFGSSARAAYLALPAARHGPGVLVVHEAFGLTPWIRDVCDRLAREGFVALAPDLHGGEQAEDVPSAIGLARKLDAARACEEIGEAITQLLRESAVDGARVGLVGFCMGGQLALAAACGRRDVAAVVDCYGVMPGVQPDYATLSAPVLGVFAENDEFVPPEASRGLEQALRAAGVRAHFEVHVGVRHGFMNDARPDVYDAHTAARAWNELLGFLRAELR